MKKVSLKKVCLILTEIHEEVSRIMLAAANKVALELGLEVKAVVWVPGALEVPLALKELMETKHFEGIVVFGLIEKGKTKHGEVMGHQVTSKILDLQLQYRVPMAVAIIGPNATMKHALGKAERTAQKAMRVVARMIELKERGFKSNKV